MGRSSVKIGLLAVLVALLAGIGTPGAADVGGSLSRSEEALKAGKTDEAVSHLLEAIRGQQELIDRMLGDDARQKELIEKQKESLDNLQERVSSQESVIDQQKETIAGYEEKMAKYESGAMTGIQAVEEAQDIEDLYRQAYQTRRTGIFDVRRRDADPYFKKAVEQFRYIAETYPQSRKAPDAQFQVAKTYHRWLNDTDQAIKEYRVVVTKWPGSEFANEAREALGELGAPVSEPE